jgi:hypothetical protein
MRALVYEADRTVVVPANVGGEVTIAPKDFRPRLEGYEDSLRGKALGAQLADRASVVFTIRPAAATAAASLVILGNLQAFLTVQQYPLLGGDVTATGATAYPYIPVDVTGTMILFKGRLVYDMEAVGVASATLSLLNWDPANAVTLRVSTQIYADVRIPQWEREREGEEVA